MPLTVTLLNVPVLLFTVASVVATLPAVVVISPVKAGRRPASNVPLLILAAFVVSVVADVAKPEILLVEIAAVTLISALTMPAVRFNLP